MTTSTTRDPGITETRCEAGAAGGLSAAAPSERHHGRGTIDAAFFEIR